MTWTKYPFFLLFWLLFAGISAQSDCAYLEKSERQTLAKEFLQNLRKGTLAVRLPYFRRQRDQIIKLLQNPSIDVETKERLLAKLRRIATERDLIREAMMKTFISHYNFSSVEFFYDKDSKAVMSGSEEYWIDTNGNYQHGIHGLWRCQSIIRAIEV